MKIYVSIPSWKNKNLFSLFDEDVQVVIADKRPSQEEFEELVKDFDGVIIGRLHSINKKVLSHTKLKFVGLIAKGTDNIDISECEKSGVAVFYTPRANITSVAEHVMTLILALSKNIITLNKSIREDEFDTFRLTTFDIQDKVLGVIGAGPIAQEVIKRAESFGMNIIVYTPHPEKHVDLKITFVPLMELLENADFVSVNIPLTDETTNFIAEKELSVMKKSAFLINTSRGKVVSEKALIETLKNKEIAGAGIDVFEEEPAYNNELFTLDNVILTPHVAGVSKEALNRMEEHVISDIISFLENKTPRFRLI